MQIKALLKSRKYMIRILSVTTLGILLTMSFFSIVLYLNVEKKIKANVYENSSKLLLGVGYNVETIEGIIKDLSVRTFFNSDVTNLMYMQENNIDYSDYALRIGKIAKDVTVMYKYVHSLYIYNNIHGKMIQIIENPYSVDEEFLRLIKEGKRFPKLKPIIREISYSDKGAKKKEKVLTYIMYQSFDTNNRLDGALIMNIKSDWLMDNVKQINTIGNNEDFYIYDENGSFININNNQEDLDTQLKNKLVVQASTEKMGIIEENIKGTDYFITYVCLNDSGLLLVKIQPVDMVYKYITGIKRTVFVVTLIFLLVAVFVSIAISRIVYKPFYRLFDHVIGDERNILKGGVEARDEIVFLEKVYNDSMDRIREFDQKKVFYKDITKAYWLKKFLSEGIEMDRQKYDALATENGIKILFDGCFAVLVLKIDNYSEFITRKNVTDRNLCKFAVLNIVGEIISERFTNEGVDMADDHVTLIINIRDGIQEFYAVLDAFVRQAQDFIGKYYCISLTAVVSSIINDINDLPSAYSMTVANSLYRFAFGKSSYITPDMINVNLSNNSSNYVEKYEAKLIESIRSRNVDKASEELIGIITYLKNLDYDSMFIAVIKLADHVKKTIEQMPGIQHTEKLLLHSDILKRITTLETIDEFLVLMNNFLNQILKSVSEQNIDPRNTMIVETVKDIILSRYNEHGLCLQEIADMLKIQPRRLSSIFKEVENMPVNEYINEIRLSWAIKLLERKKLNVNEIIEKVGINNETYFYSIFKKRYGMTPKEYVLKKRTDYLVADSDSY